MEHAGLVEGCVTGSRGGLWMSRLISLAEAGWVIPAAIEALAVVLGFRLFREADLDDLDFKDGEVATDFVSPLIDIRSGDNCLSAPMLSSTD